MYLNIKKDTPVKCKLLKYFGEVESEYQGNVTIKHAIDVEVDGETLRWEATALTKKQMKQNHIKMGDDVVIEKVFRDNRNYINVHLSDDARGIAAVKNAKAAGTDYKTVSDDKDKKITMGMCMNCASRIISQHEGVKVWSDERVAEEVVSLAKAIYAEYTQEPKAGVPPITEADIAGEEAVPDDLPF